MAIVRKNHFIGQTKDWLLAQLKAVQQEIVSGKTEASIGMGETNIGFQQNGWTLERREDEILYSLSLLDSTNYPYTAPVRMTVFGYPQTQYGR